MLEAALEELDSLSVEPESVAIPLASGNDGRACIKVAITNSGNRLVIIARATIRICMSRRIAGRRLRWCVPFSTQMSLEIEGKPCEQLEIPAGETVLFTACTDIGDSARKKIQDFDSPQFELQLHELHDDVEFTRTLDISADNGGCNG